MKLITQSELSRIAGITRQAINKAIEKELLKIAPKSRGKINLHSKLTVEYLKKNSRQRRNGIRKKSDGKSSSKKKPSNSVTREQKAQYEQDEIRKLKGFLSQESLQVNLSAISRTAGEKLLILEKVKSLQIKTERERGDLVSKILITQFIGKLYTIDTNELQILGNKIAPEIAAICGVDNNRIITKVAEKLDKEIFKCLQHIKRLMNDYLTKIKSENIK